MTSLGVADRVRLAGHVAADRLPALYRQATAHTMLSAYEGFGLTLVEAMACGCPVLATSESATPEVAGGAAWLLDRVDAATAALALSRLAHEAMLRDRLRAQGLARATGFTWDRCARETLGVYARLLDRRATG
jgi:glycosyltransferase involved in cell wall biosynthesis